MRRRISDFAAGPLFITLLATSIAVPAQAQLGGASSASSGMADNTTATVRGFAAIGTNPAGLGLDGPSWSYSLVGGRVNLGLDPVSLADFTDFDGVFIPESTRREWLREIRADGAQTGSISGEITPFALQLGRWGLQATTSGRGRGNVNGDAAEVIFFGNAGLSGSPADLSPDGQTDGYGLTTFGVSYGIPFDLSTNPDEEGSTLAVGATVKYMVGNALFTGRSNGSSVTSDPIALAVRFPVMHTDFDDYQFNNGTGIGVDFGFIVQGSRWSVGATVQNLINTFEWDPARFQVRPIDILFDKDTREANIDEVTPTATDLARLDDLQFDPSFSAGIAYMASQDLTLTGEFKAQSTDGLNLGTESHFGVGAELRSISFLPLRAGVALVTDGFRFGGGAGLILGPLNVAASFIHESGDEGEASILSLGLSFNGQ